jgi:hypothetical protein
MGQNVGPALTAATGFSWNWNDVTTPKFPPMMSSEFLRRS